MRSPEGTGASVKARLQAKLSPKSPETLKRIEDRAVQLHQLHVEATQQRAAKENQRAKDVAAARLRRAASSRQNLLARFEQQATHREDKKRIAQHGQAFALCSCIQKVSIIIRYGFNKHNTPPHRTQFTQSHRHKIHVPYTDTNYVYSLFRNLHSHRVSHLGDGAPAVTPLPCPPP